MGKKRKHRKRCDFENCPRCDGLGWLVRKAVPGCWRVPRWAHETAAEQLAAGPDGGPAANEDGIWAGVA
jgi:hypothetical protein